ncbi:uncharacterized protein MONBRDRAFT_28151 [Monosiga brevicollis MX1]|uniref:Right handed beta helix domain-containing protein n=1 Tax=Monosiga brevicollis TaxID=81824 RepID=A9V7C6_MONBE|nr:uncharacterized protein MONBRDRAFT_28151 [Monosiga brevicollis MX1]EDQ86562.1 predicted protein [Monosiga brevicollis MX1]|eukprot:XP_001748675.1 hypothetical protein [Monosiga brevicollis MX1]
MTPFASDVVTSGTMRRFSFLNLTYCLTFVNCGNITVENLHFGGCSTAIHFLFGANIVRSDFLVQNNYFRDHQVPPDAYNPQSGFWSRTIDFSSMAVATVYNATIQHNAANRIDAFFDTVNVGLVNLVLQANTLHHCGGNCVIVRGENSLVDGNVFSYDQPQRMFLHGTTDIMLGPVHGSTVISNNVFVRRGEYEGSPDGCGIDFEVASVGVQVLNNLFYQPFASGVMIFGHGTTAQNFTLGGNAFVQAGCEAVRGDRAGVVFVCPGGAQPSGQLRDNVFQTCTNGVPAILEGQPNCSSKVLRTNNTVTAQFPLAATPHLEVFAPPMTSTDPTVLMLTNATSSDPLAAIRYTMDGSVPSSSSPLFPNSGLELPWPAEVLTINLRAFSDNRLPSVVGSAILERWAYRP